MIAGLSVREATPADLDRLVEFQNRDARPENLDAYLPVGDATELHYTIGTPDSDLARLQEDLDAVDKAEC